MKRRLAAALAAFVIMAFLPVQAFGYDTPVKSRDRRFQIMVPENWSDMSGALDPTGTMDREYMIEAGSDETESYMVFREEDLDRVYLKTFDDYFNALAEAVSGSEQFTDVLLSSPEDRVLTKCGMLCRRSTFSATWQPDDGKPSVVIAGWVYAVQGGGGTCYQFFAWSRAGYALEAGPVFDEVVDSFVILK